MDAPAYLDSEQMNALIGRMTDQLVRHDFDHDGDGGLPLRPDVRDYVVAFLCRDHLGPLRAGGLPAPTVALNPDGTVTLGWPVAGSNDGLRLHVPCRGVVRITKRHGGARCDETLRHLDPRQVRQALDPLFDWLRDLSIEAP